MISPEQQLGGWDFVEVFKANIGDLGVSGADRERTLATFMSEQINPRLDDIGLLTDPDAFMDALSTLDTQFGHVVGGEGESNWTFADAAVRVVDGVEDRMLGTNVLPRAFPLALRKGSPGEMTFDGIEKLPEYAAKHLAVSPAGFQRITGKVGIADDKLAGTLNAVVGHEVVSERGVATWDAARKENEERNAILHAEVGGLALSLAESMLQAATTSESYRNCLTILTRRVLEACTAYDIEHPREPVRWFVRTEARPSLAGHGADDNIVAKTRQLYIKAIFAKIGLAA
jgi:hypothetical protein